MVAVIVKFSRGMMLNINKQTGGEMRQFSPCHTLHEYKEANCKDRTCKVLISKSPRVRSTRATAVF